MHKLAASGCEVYLNARDREAAERAAADQERATGGRVTAVPGDVSRPEVLPGILRDVARRHGHVDILVHCAVSLHRMQATAPQPEEMRQDFDVAVAPLLYSASVLPTVMPHGRGRVVAVSSSGAGRVVPAYVSLGMAKGALETLVRYLGAELAPSGTTVNAVSTARMDRGRTAEDDPVAASLAARTPAGRLTQPDDVADTVALLCTDEASWLHGQVITVDGGLGLVG
ncbi:SDR family oxidoreductase (plasmid) [Streptomyces sp. NBC_00390]|uniref:SDR family NAD(P)-dependent oxidoreductase n=1 Tax=Streptomyces sp. NBC_00390 TaxID=2975736 RepID=UPI002E1EDCDF